MRALFLCGGAPASAAPAGPFDRTETLSFRGSRPSLRIEQLDPKLLEALNDREHDLLEVASCVYGADRLVSRSGKGEKAQGWVRDLTLVVPVRAIEKWRALRPALEEMLDFLTGDHWHFKFIGFASPLLRPTSLFDDRELRDRTCVTLFSGGLDSLSGAIWDRAVNRHKSLLVSHRSHAKVSARQTELVKQLREWDPDFLRRRSDLIGAGRLTPVRRVDRRRRDTSLPEGAAA